jgi:biopolymer transport protein ExbD
MIVRPLDLASRLRPEPRDFDALFYVNAGMLALFFSLFGSRFVIAPGLELDFQVPVVAGAGEGAAPTTCYLSVLRTGQIFTDDGLFSLAQLRGWLEAQARLYRRPSLLIRASADVPISSLTEIDNLAHRAGFVRVVVGAEDPARSLPQGG